MALHTLRARAHKGWLTLGAFKFPCALGRSGQRARKREGDGASPIGLWRFEQVMYRADRTARPQTSLPAQPLRKTDGWCDAVGDRNYNRAVRHPYPASAEALWRADHLYDVIVVLSHNRRPRSQGCGSAIFMHIAQADFAGTAGCIALRKQDLLTLLKRLSAGDRIAIGRR